MLGFRGVCLGGVFEPALRPLGGLSGFFISFLGASWGPLRASQNDDNDDDDVGDDDDDDDDEVGGR